MEIGKCGHLEPYIVPRIRRTDQETFDYMRKCATLESSTDFFFKSDDKCNYSTVNVWDPL